MSHRGGRKPLQSVPGKLTGTSADSSGPEMMASPTMDSGPVNSLGFPIHITNTMQSNIKQGLGDITSRLNRTLGQYANEFSDDDKDDGQDWSTTDGDVRKFGVEEEKREFQARYESITARVDAMEQERTELMKSMAEWLESDQIQTLPENKESSDTVESQTNSDKKLRDQLVNTKMGFEKLKQMNHEKERLDSQGKDTGLLQEESSKLQMKVIAKFKKLHETNKLAATKRSFGAHWKHASEEIVGLLRRIRSEGTGDIEALEEQLEKAVNGIRRQAEEMMRLEGRIREKEEMVEKWSAENAKLTNDNLLLNSEKDKCRDIIRKLKKALIEERRKKGTPTTPEEVEEIAEGKMTRFPPPQEEHGARKVPPARAATTGRVLCQICRKRVDSVPVTEKKLPEPDATVTAIGPVDGDGSAAEDSSGQADQRGEEASIEDLLILKEENDWLTTRVSQLEQTLIEKETKLMKLEMQLLELMEAVKTSSPEIIQTLSMTDPDTPKNLSGSKQKEKASGKGKTAVQPPATSTTPTVSSKRIASKKDSTPPVTHTSKALTRKSAKTPASEELQPTEQLPTVTKPPSESDLQHRAEISQLTEQRDKLQEELVTMKGQLMRAQRELITLKYASSSPASIGAGAGSRTMREGALTGGSGQLGKMDDANGDDSSTRIASKTSATQEAPVKLNPPPVVKYDDEFQAYAELMRQDKDARPTRRMSRPRQIPRKTSVDVTTGEEMGSVAGGRGGGLEMEAADDPDQMEEFTTFDQGMQTDPQMDPLGQWSNVPSLNKRRRTAETLPSLEAPVEHQAPIAPPPNEWTYFDPTGPVTPVTAIRAGSVSHQMRAGHDPSKLDAEDIVVYVDRELGRIVQGINGFTSYLKRLIQREVTDMITTNQDIRRNLSEATLRKLDQGVSKESTVPPTEDGRRSRALTTPIRRGRFEITKDNKPSKFATKNAYATLQSGGRRFYHSASPLPQWNIHSKTPTPVPFNQTGGWSTFARDHITMADEANARDRYLPSPHDTICSRLQHQIDMIGRHAIEVLRGTTMFFKETVTRQMEEYSTLHTAFGLRQELKTLMAASPAISDGRASRAIHYDDEKKGIVSDFKRDGGRGQGHDVPLKLTRSTSHNSFLESRNMNYFPDEKQVGFDMTFPADVPVETRSLSSIQSSHRYLPPLAYYDSLKPKNRHEMLIPKATLPKRGLVKLQVKQATVTVGPVKAGVVDTKRRSRPMAISHRGLQDRQRDLLTKVRQKPEDGQDRQREEPLTTILELKRQIFQFQTEKTPPAAEQSAAVTSEPDTENPRSLPPLENERRRIIVHAQDQLRIRDQMETWDKYVGHLSGHGPHE